MATLSLLYSLVDCAADCGSVLCITVLRPPPSAASRALASPACSKQRRYRVVHATLPDVPPLPSPSASRMTCLMCALLYAQLVATSHRTLQWTQSTDTRQPLLQPSWRLGGSGTQVSAWTLHVLAAHCYIVLQRQIDLEQRVAESRCRPSAAAYKTVFHAAEAYRA